MAEYIEREAAKSVLNERYKRRAHIHDLDSAAQLKIAEFEIGDIPAADVRPVVRGKWKPRDLTCGRSYYYCSACEETVDMPTAMGIPMFNFCPNCGADMREES